MIELYQDLDIPMAAPFTIVHFDLVIQSLIFHVCLFEILFVFGQDLSRSALMKLFREPDYSDGWSLDNSVFIRQTITFNIYHIFHNMSHSEKGSILLVQFYRNSSTHFVDIYDRAHSWNCIENQIFRWMISRQLYILFLSYSHSPSTYSTCIEQRTLSDCCSSKETAAARSIKK